MTDKDHVGYRAYSGLIELGDTQGDEKRQAYLTDRKESLRRFASMSAFLCAAGQSKPSCPGEGHSCCYFQSQYTLITKVIWVAVVTAGVSRPVASCRMRG